MEEKTAVASLAALAHPIRLRVFRALVGAGPEGMNPRALAALLDVASSTLSFHLKELHRAKLLSSRQDGRSIIYMAHFDTMNALLGYLTENCCSGNPCSPVSNCSFTSEPKS